MKKGGAAGGGRARDCAFFLLLPEGGSCVSQLCPQPSFHFLRIPLPFCTVLYSRTPAWEMLKMAWALVFFLFFCFFKLFAPLIIIYYFWGGGLCWVFVSVRGLSLVAASRGHSSSRCAGLSLSWPLLWSTGSRRAGSVVVAHGPSCSAACGIFPDQGSNPCPLH